MVLLRHGSMMFRLMKQKNNRPTYKRSKHTDIFCVRFTQEKMNGHAIPSRSSPKITLDSTANNALEATSPRESRGDANWSTNWSPLSTRSKVASHGRWRGAKFVLMSV